MPSHTPHGTTPKNGFSYKSSTKGPINLLEGGREGTKEQSVGGDDFPALC